MMTILTADLLHLFADGLVVGLDVVVGHLVLGRKLDVESRGNGDVKLKGKIILCFDVLCFLSFVLEGLAEHVDFLFTDISEELFAQDVVHGVHLCLRAIEFLHDAHGYVAGAEAWHVGLLCCFLQRVVEGFFVVGLLEFNGDNATHGGTFL